MHLIKATVNVLSSETHDMYNRHIKVQIKNKNPEK